ncbi:GNAT family N-acetyltransferase [Chamaesiphon polymorphus]|uniref:GNAT family N-acetyltransferase n=1 Tax=Chamaesiphon polymorphus CCALA 037 TaxID=2107692 RepID=A0A2T1GG24_9CYAN|nr:GNAT family N-acetyltransferase [Chamaesiphon polymorphus]PSB56525.1 GNAT family N-acetyltransferase [Chamaesiphon polymorphus CCALA 037]
MDIEIVPCSIGHMEKSIEGAEAFENAYGLQAIDGYLPFPGALEYMLKQMQSAQLCDPWLPYLMVFRPDRALVGFCGFKSVPDPQQAIEIGYSVAPNYQGRGFATSAVRQLLNIAFESELVNRVCAHTLAEYNASARVLAKCGMTKAAETIDPDLGCLWKWEIGR